MRPLREALRAESLRSRLLVITAAMVMLPLVAVVVVIGRWMYDSAERQSLHVQQQSAAAVGGEVRSLIRDVATQLQLLDSVVALQTRDRPEQESLLGNLLANNRIYQDIALVTPDAGATLRVSRTEAAAAASAEALETQGLTQAIARRGTYIGTVRFDEDLREPLATIAAPLIDRRSGDVAAALVATVRFKQVWELLGESATPGDTVVYVVDSAGRVVAHRDPAVVLRETQASLPARDGRATGLTGDVAVVATHSLGLSRSGLTVVAEQSLSSALTVANQTREVMLVATTLALLLTSLIVVLTVRRFVRPIEALVDSTDRIAAGDLSHRADVSSRGDIGRLARSFNAMAARIQEQVLLLERRVGERTSELEESVSVQKRLIEQLEHQAANDFLTGLPNRYSLESRLQLELARARRTGCGVALLLLDLDDFKGVNDTFGHAVGDELLIEVGKRIRSTVRDVDAVCRLGGDEFAVVQPDVDSRAGASAAAQRLLDAFSDTFVLQSQELYTGVSIGVTVSADSTGSISDFMQQADVALYRSKAEGRSTYRFFECTMDTAVRRRMILSQDLRGAVSRGEVFLEYQPQVRLSDRAVIGVEALVRWRHPLLGVVPPDQFVPIAEGAGLIHVLGEWVLREACRQARDWRRQGLPALPVAVNVSARQVNDAGFADTVSGILAEFTLEPGALELEITETVLMEAKDHVARTVATLQEMGVRISLDDFGRGYASLDYVRRYPLGTLKIDRAFVRDMMSNPRSEAVVGAVIALASRLDLRVIAEGVEQDDQLHRLTELGCHAVQGYCFSYPVGPDELIRLVTRGSDRIPGLVVAAPDGVIGSA